MSEAERLHFAIDQAMKADEPDNLYYHFQEQIYSAMKEGLVSIPEMGALEAFLSLWWEGRSYPDRENEGDC